MKEAKITAIKTWCELDNIDFEITDNGCIVRNISYYEAINFEQYTQTKIADSFTVRSMFDAVRPMNLSFWIRYPEFDNCIPPYSKNHALVSAALNVHNAPLVHTYEDMKNRFDVLFITD